MTRVRSFDFAKILFGAAMLAALTIALPAFAQNDGVVEQARGDGLVGEQADGYLGFTPGSQISADLRGRVDQINIQRRALYTRRAAERSVTVNEMAAAVACEVFANRIDVGERYRDEAGQWRTRGAGQAVSMPSFCPN